MMIATCYVMIVETNRNWSCSISLSSSLNEWWTGQEVKFAMVFHFNQQHAIALSLYKTKIKLNNGNLKPEYSKKKKKENRKKYIT